jgi:hypothetical protein
LLNANFADIETLIAGLAAAVAAVTAAQAAATAAQASANAAAADAASASADAATASASAQAAADQTALANSYVSGATITATDAGADVTISISAHTRYYPQSDGTTTSVAVSAGTIIGQAYSTFYYIYYDDPARAGGTVTYVATTSDVTAAQTGDRHTVGSVTTPAALAAPSGGSPIRPPGPGQVP